MRKKKIRYLAAIQLLLAFIWLFGIIESLKINNTNSVNEEKKIRVLLMNSEYESYYHPVVTVQYNGIEKTYTMESEELDDGELLIEGCEGGISILTIQRQQGIPNYKGNIQIKKTDNGFLIVNELPVETYLEAVVPGEMPASYEAEALKAQAVCARTYAYKQMEKESLQEYGADVDDSVNYQVYENVRRHDTTNQAVRETEGQVLYQGNDLIEAYYFSTSSGMTSTDEVWGVQEASSYLKSVECDFDANGIWGNWSVEIPWDNIAEDYVNNLQIEKISQAGAVLGINVITEQDSYRISGEYNIRQFLSPKGCIITGNHGEQMEGGTLLPSAYFEMQTEPGKSILIEGRGYGHGVGMSQNAANEMAKKGYTWDEILKYFYNEVEIRIYL